MARFKDVLPSQQGWIHDLAKAEVHPDAEKLLQLGKNFEPQQLVEESTIDFLSELRGHFQEYARLFNSYAEGGNKFPEAKVYSVAQTAADFMIYRNQIKLVVSHVAHGLIQIAFAQHMRGTLSIDGQVQSNEPGAPTPSSASPQELIAVIGPFRDVYWSFQGERVNPAQVARFYFAEFIRMSRDGRRSRTQQKQLLDQIKALLHEQGLDL